MALAGATSREHPTGGRGHAQASTWAIKHDQRRTSLQSSTPGSRILIRTHPTQPRRIPSAVISRSPSCSASRSLLPFAHLPLVLLQPRCSPTQSVRTWARRHTIILVKVPADTTTPVISPCLHSPLTSGTMENIACSGWN